VATVRSAAGSRNRRRPCLAGLLLLILAVLIALAARANATPAGATPANAAPANDPAPASAKPADDPIALAIRFANALTGSDDDDVDDVDDNDLAVEDEDAAGSIDSAAAADDAASDGDELDDGRDDGDEAAAMPISSDDLVDAFDADEPELGLGDRTLAEHAGELALDNDPASAAALTSDELGFASAPAGAAEAYEARMRRRRTSIVGRLDVALAWRRSASAPMHAPPHSGHEIWLLATWSP